MTSDAALFDLSGRTALVTGASKGVGKGIAIELAKAGCDVAVNFHSDQQGAERTVREIESLGRKAVAIPGDVARPAEVHELFRRTLEAFSRLDILVNNAGVQTWSSLLDLKDSDWERVIATNLTGCFLC